IPAKVNQIPFNPWPGAPYECSSEAVIKSFSDIVFAAGFSAPVRTPRGRDILAACGQLKSTSVKLRTAARPPVDAASPLLPRRGRLSGVLYLIFGSALAVYGVLVGGLYVFQRHLLYLPGGGRPVLGELATFGVREVGVTTADGLSLLSWYLPPR